MLPEVTRKMRAPRALSVPYRLGFALGEADAPGLQRDILRQLLKLALVDEVPHLAEFERPLAG
ncbi:MAG: hypothetical protein ACYC8T_22635 [Myxococcaceae bacterium]